MKIGLSWLFTGTFLFYTINAKPIDSFENKLTGKRMKAYERILKPVDLSEPPSSIFPSIQHPYLPVYADPKFNTSVPTSSWITNLFYPSEQNLAPTTPDPYILRILDDFGGNPGLSISQPHDKIIGSYPPVNNVPFTPAGYMINGVVVDLRITSKEWKSEKPKQLITSWDLFGANISLSTKQGSIEFPISRGTPFITSLYHGLTPQFFTQHAIIKIEANSTAKDTYTDTKFKISFNNNPTSTFIIYAIDGPITLKKVDLNNLIAEKKYNGVIQVAKLPNSESESVLDAHHGVWATGGKIETNKRSSRYRILWNKAGNKDKDLLIYAYPHHLKSFLRHSVVRTPLVLQSSSKGPMHAVIGNKWTFQESDLPTTKWFLNRPVPEESTKNEILGQLEKDINSNYTAQTQLGDNYFSGKGLQKFALIALLLNKPEVTELKNPELAQTSLEKLKEQFVIFLENRQPDPFRYDTVYQGIVARAGLPESMNGTGNRDAAFGHSYYNDHHYHQGYLIVTAAIIHYLDPEWRADELKKWTETLIRDSNNPVENDLYFTQFRNWDWFAGHSWASGLKVGGALDGRDQESVPESVNFYWGVKLWGIATKNKPMSDLANLQLALTKKTTYEYFWLLDNNQNRPKSVIENKVIGIYFEQKSDYTTFFGRYIEYIHGIQQLPMTPILADYIRTREFVTQEWDQKLKNIAPKVKGSWAGILYLNYANINPSAAYPILKTVEIDDGQTRAFSLYLAASRPKFRRRSLSKLMSPLLIKDTL